MDVHSLSPAVDTPLNVDSNRPASAHTEMYLMIHLHLLAKLETFLGIIALPRRRVKPYFSCMIIQITPKAMQGSLF